MWIDIEHLQSPEGDGGYFFKRHPCIKVDLGILRTAGDIHFITVYGAIDTGADHIYVDTGLMAANGAVPKEYVPVNSQESHPTYDCIVRAMPLLGPSQITVCGIDAQAKGWPYMAVLGRQFLSVFRLEYEPSIGHFRLLGRSAGTGQ